MNIRRLRFAFAAVALISFAAPSAFAKVPAEEANKLGNELTPLGAIKAGNKEGTIPAWEGGITSPPANYKPGDHHPDPFAQDKPLFQITAKNLAEYKDKLSPGQVAMFERYPDTWVMNVYPTRRSASYPAEVYEWAKKNATTAELAEGGNGVASSAYSYPFPIPQNGLEAIWNHLLRYRGSSTDRTVLQVSPTASGAYIPVRIHERVRWEFASRPGISIEEIDNKLARFLQTVEAPARLAGNILLVHETVNQLQEPRRAWTYNPGQRRVRRAPNVAYDNPGTAADAQRTSDNLDLFNGAPDRYSWELKGRKEMYVPYNSYKAHSGDVTDKDLVKPGHLNPDLLRYELHRVWEVDATLRSGTRHIYGRRTFFLDEDSWQAVVVDHYDNRGEMWRLGEAYTINYYDQPLLWSTMQSFYDLQNGRYLTFGINNQEKEHEFNKSFELAEFTPEALRRAGLR